MDQNWPEQNRFHAAFLVRKTLTESWQGTPLIGSYSVAVYTFQPQMCGLQATIAICGALAMVHSCNPLNTWKHLLSAQPTGTTEL